MDSVLKVVDRFHSESKSSPHSGFVASHGQISRDQLQL